MMKILLCSLCVCLLLACSGKDPDLARGELIYTNACKVCHAQGINGAPVLGNKNNWASRKDQGLEVLVEHASGGFGLMPAKGGRTELSEDEIRFAVKYMLSTL